MTKIFPDAAITFACIFLIFLHCSFDADLFDLRHFHTYHLRFLSPISLSRSFLFSPSLSLSVPPISFYLCIMCSMRV